MAKHSKPKAIDLTEEQAEALKQRVIDDNLSQDDRDLMLGLINFTFWMQRQLQKAKLSVKRLKNIFGIKTEKYKANNKKDDDDDDDPHGTDPDDTGDSDTCASSSVPTTMESVKKKSVTPGDKKQKPRWNLDENHGRKGAGEYSGCQVSHLYHKTLKPGDPCPVCSATGSTGRLYEADPGHIVRLIGQPPVSGTVYHKHNLRCANCTTWFPPHVPKEIADEKKYSATARTSIATNHYLYGIPFHRLETLQAQQGIPVPDATQWRQMKILHKIINPVYEMLTYYVANSTSVSYDDTTHRFLKSVIKPATRGHSTRAYSTVVVAEHEGHRIYWFRTNEMMAGKKMAELLKQRNTDEPLLSMTDALAHNFPKVDEIEAALAAKWCVSLCLAHGRRQFFELLPSFEDECGFILDVISEVYDHERHCKAKQYTGEARLAYHQAHSGPLMDGLNVWLHNQLRYRCACEPNAPFGEAVSYMLRHWEALTRFLQVPDALIDNNITERTLKIVIRYRKNSLFYRTSFGAEVGDCMMTLLHTAAQWGVSPFDYLNALQRNAKAVANAPQAWMPWNYKATLARLEEEQAA